jgi:hypothetical protein
MADDEDVALTISEAFVYKIPPRQTAGGHKASDWTEQVAVVRVQVVTKGRDYFVRLVRPDSGKIFAIAPTRFGSPSAVEQTTDSSRYFALRIEDGKGALSPRVFGGSLLPILSSHTHLPPPTWRKRRQPCLHWPGL